MMMKRICDHPYYAFSSFEDLHLEKERLILKSKLIEAKINLEVILIRKVFSFSNMAVSLAGEVILPKISGILHDLFKKSSTL